MLIICYDIVSLADPGHERLNVSTYVELHAARWEEIEIKVTSKDVLESRCAQSVLEYAIIHIFMLILPSFHGRCRGKQMNYDSRHNKIVLT